MRSRYIFHFATGTVEEITMADLDLTADIIDVRDIIERFEELESEFETAYDSDEADDKPELSEWIAGLAAENTLEAEEYESLRALLDDLSGYGGDEQWRGDWYPETLIADSYFETYMNGMLEDIGDLPKNLPSYLTVTVDYDALKMDYTSIEIGDVTYWYR